MERLSSANSLFNGLQAAGSCSALMLAAFKETDFLRASSEPSFMPSLLGVVAAAAVRGEYMYLAAEATSFCLLALPGWLLDCADGVDSGLSPTKAAVRSLESFDIAVIFQSHTTSPSFTTCMSHVQVSSHSAKLMEPLQSRSNARQTR